MNVSPRTGSDPDLPATYRIRVRGSIKSSWRDSFEGMALEVTPQPEGPPITTLEGVLIDQAALVGVINALQDLRLVVLSVECLEDASAGDATSPH